METISILDDDEDFTRILTFFLEEHYKVVPFHDWQEALKSYAQDPPDLIMLDISLPDIDGTQILTKLKEMPNLGKIKVIAVTAHTLPNDREKYLKVGFDDYLPKPITDSDAVLSLVKNCLKKA
ncbi:MAG: response regulator [Chlamydiia bacterium]|nr:response regulator [Chlamydiia bacterium]